eukprot:GHVS01028774.1.p1 GENE.GHVS01028774.1~~GHVS01028774.1.p1  ORF type:complete len:383 (-),score=47.18 GHVS01028774.1:30-1178(-)
MNEILPLLYLGGLSDAEKTELLLSMGIRGVVMCCTYLEKPLTYPTSSTTPINEVSPPHSTSPIHPAISCDDEQPIPQAGDAIGTPLCSSSSCPSSNTRDALDVNGGSTLSICASVVPPLAPSSSTPHEGAGDNYGRECSHNDLLQGEASVSQETGVALPRSCTVGHHLDASTDSSCIVMSVLMPADDEPPPTLTYYRVCIEDTSCEPISMYFEEVGEFIDSFMLRGEGVLVHCKAGVSRSATVIISYLVGKMHFALSRAFYHVLSRRKIICPNVGFMEQLCEYEVETRSAKSVINQLDSLGLVSQQDDCEGNADTSDMCDEAADDDCGQSGDKRDDGMSQRATCRAAVDDLSTMPSVCLFKYIDWYTADADRRAGVPDIEHG